MRFPQFFRAFQRTAERNHLRGDFRATAFASYAAYLVREHCPHNGEAAAWYDFLERMLDVCRAGTPPSERLLVQLELGFLSLAGLSPDFTGADFAAATVPFSIDLGHAGTGGKTVQLPSSAARLLAERVGAAEILPPEDVTAAVRFLGLFLRYHLDSPPDIRRNTRLLLAMARRK